VCTVSVEHSIGTHFSDLEIVAKVFDGWKLKVYALMDDLRIELGAFWKTMNRVVLNLGAASSEGVFLVLRVAAVTSHDGNLSADPFGHHVEHGHQEVGSSVVYTHVPLLVKGMHSPPNPLLFRSSSM
jgi:hypothetical protein